MDLESRKRKSRRCFPNLGEQDVGEDWIEKIRSDANAMLNATRLSRMCATKPG